MVASGLEEIQQVVPEIMVNLKRDQEKNPISAEIQVNSQRERFSLQVKSRFDLLFKFRDIFNFIKENIIYFDRLREIEYAAINGMLSTLDPHSVLLTPEEYAEMHFNTQGRFGGLGIVIGVRDHQLTVINPIEDTPAARAGVLANDRIVQIGLDSTINMSLSDAVSLMRGEPKTQVDIYIQREGWSAPKKFTITRDNIKVKSVKSRYLGEGIGIVRVSNFQNKTTEELKTALKLLKREAPGKRLKGLILDLRGNPGGLLN
jgi:carboxyl-terminal processing protease